MKIHLFLIIQRLCFAGIRPNFFAKLLSFLKTLKKEELAIDVFKERLLTDFTSGTYPTIIDF
ncbi:MAG: hypothetical protein GY820_24195 [Gammaproteobacteria bacterium]|nr:hypothetical protein [Gammaproteobacteria bacterium]